MSRPKSVGDRDVLDTLNRLIAARERVSTVLIDYLNGARNDTGDDATAKEFREAAHKLQRIHPDAETLPVEWFVCDERAILGDALRAKTNGMSKLDLEAWRDQTITAVTARTQQVVAAMQHICAREQLACLKRETEVQHNEQSAGAVGPTMEGCFFEAGQRYHFPALQWRLLKALWNNGSVPIGTIGDEIYPGDDKIEGKLKKLKSDTEDKLLEHKLPYEITSPMAGHYELKKLPRK